MGLKYVEDQGDWFGFTLKGGARQQCCGCGLTHDIFVRRKGRRYECVSPATNGPRQPRAAPARRWWSSPIRDRASLISALQPCQNFA